MKNFYFTYIPLALTAIVIIGFLIIVPKGGDLFSASGDFMLGPSIGMLFLICLVIDLTAHFTNQKNKKGKRR